MTLYFNVIPSNLFRTNTKWSTQKKSRVVSINQLVHFKRTQNHNTIFQAPFSREIMVLKYAITQITVLKYAITQGFVLWERKHIMYQFIKSYQFYVKGAYWNKHSHFNITLYRRLSIVSLNKKWLKQEHQQKEKRKNYL
jgi:hypothetical protein